MRCQAGIGRAHEGDQIGHQFVEERGFLAQLVAVADGAADDAPLHIAAPLVGGHHTVADQKRSRPQMVGNHPKRRRRHIGTTGFTGGGFDQGGKQVNFIVAVHMLEDGRQALEAHAGVHTGRGQRREGAVFVHFKLHEHVVPNFDEAVAVFLGAAGRAARDVVPMIVKNLAARAARAGVGHHPKVVALVAPALVVADADDPLGGQANFFGPDVVGLVVLLVDGGQQTFFGQLVHLGQQLPGPFQRFALEIVAKRPVAEHFEKGVVPRGVAHVFQIIVFATGAQAGLHRGGADI